MFSSWLNKLVSLELPTPQQSFPLQSAEQVSSPLVGDYSFKIEDDFDDKPSQNNRWGFHGYNNISSQQQLWRFKWCIKTNPWDRNYEDLSHLFNPAKIRMQCQSQRIAKTWTNLAHGMASIWHVWHIALSGHETWEKDNGVIITLSLIMFNPKTQMAFLISWPPPLPYLM